MYQDEQTATNPQTGEKVVLRNGAWVPASQTAPAAPSPQAPSRIMGAPKPIDPVEQARLGMAQQDQARQNDIAPLQKQALEAQVSNAQNQRTQTVLGQANKLRDDYNASPVVKSYQAMLPSYIAGISSAPTPAGDLDLIYAYAKIMDPNSVVREGEAATVAGGDTWVGQKVAEMTKQLGSGGTFRPEYRKQLREEMKRRGGAMNQQFIQERVRYKTMAQRYGVDPLDIVGEHPGAGFKDEEAGAFGTNLPPTLDFYGKPTTPEAVRPATDNYGNETGGGDFAFNDQVPEVVKGYRLTPAQEAEIAEAVRVGDKGQALALEQKFTGYAPTPETVAAIETAIRTKRPISFEYSSVDEAKKAELRARMGRQDDAGAGGKPNDLALLATQGGFAGFPDEIAGLTGGLGAILLGKDPVKGYNDGRDTHLLRLEDARQRQGVAGTVAEVAGGVAMPVGALGRPAAGASLLTRMGQGARAGAAGGAAAGVGYGEGSNRLLTGALGGVGGAMVGSALPVVGQVASSRVNGLRRMLGRDPELPRRLVDDAISAEGQTPRAAGAMMEEAQGRGSPMALGDTGDNARQLLASVARQPGPARTLTRETVLQRQLAQQERIASAVTRDLGPTANIREASEALIEQARTASKPHYDAFEAAPGASSVKLDDLIARPSVKRALERAYRLAAEEGDDPTALGFTLNEAGEPVLGRVPSFRTLDYIKRGLDDVVEDYRDSTTGVLRLNSEGRAVNNTLRSLVARIDKVNPAYRAARDAYAGPARLNEALQKGSKALTRSPDDLSAEIARMSEPEREMYRMGLRKQITDFLESKTDGSDKVQALIGTPKKRAALARAFGGRAEYDRFVATLGDEAAMGQTYRAVTGNSATAERLAFDQTTNDTGLAETAMDAALRGGKDGLWSAGVAAVQKIRDVGRFGAGEAGQRTRESVAALLTETDPAVLRDLVRAAQRAQAMQRVQARRGGQPRRIVSSAVGNAGGAGLNALMPTREPVK